MELRRAEALRYGSHASSARATQHLVRTGGTFALALAALAISPAEARGQGRWLELRSRHFVVVSDAGEERAREASTAFERVRGVLHVALKGANLEDARQVVAFAVRRESDLRELLPQFWEHRGQRPGGAYWAGPYQHYIALRVDRPEPEWRVRAVHELVHLVTHVNYPDVPPWLDEGLSEVWDTLAVDDQGVEIGLPARNHVKTLRGRRAWIPIPDLLSIEAPPAQDRRRLDMFYAESWALVHYMMFGGDEGPAGKPDPGYEAVARYMEQIVDGQDAVAAARSTFGDLEELERALKDYVRAGRFRTLRVRGEEGDIEGNARATQVRTLSAGESLAVRARAVAAGQRPATALPLLTEAVRLEPDNPAVLEAFGAYCFQENKLDDAAQWFDKAIQTGSASHLAYFYRAILAGDSPSTGQRPVPPAKRAVPPAKRAVPPAGGPVPPAGRPVPPAETLLLEAIELEPTFAPAYARLADLYARDPDHAGEALPLARRAADLEPDHSEYWLDLGRLLLGLNRPREAREAGERGLAAARSANIRRAAEAFLREARKAEGGLPKGPKATPRCGGPQTGNMGEFGAFWGGFRA